MLPSKTLALLPVQPPGRHKSLGVFRGRTWVWDIVSERKQNGPNLLPVAPCSTVLAMTLKIFHSFCGHFKGQFRSIWKLICQTDLTWFCYTFGGVPQRKVACSPQSQDQSLLWNLTVLTFALSSRNGKGNSCPLDLRWRQTAPSVSDITGGLQTLTRK